MINRRDKKFLFGISPQLFDFSRFQFLLLLLCLWLIICIPACSKNDTPQQSGGLFSSDETPEAVKLVIDANEDLKKIKKMFKDNEGRLQDLEKALKDKNGEKVRTLCGELDLQLAEGMEIGNSAILKIESAEGMNINQDFKDYLLLKAESLRKYIEAYAERQKAANLLHDGYDSKDAAKRNQVVIAFKEREVKFKRIIEEARKTSEEANSLAKESLKKKI